MMQMFFMLTGFLLYSIRKGRDRDVEMNVHLKMLNEEKNKFIGIAGHDLRNPVGSIHSFADILLEDYSEELRPESRTIVEYIRDLSNHTLVLLGNLLDISMIESGKINIVKKEGDYLAFLEKNVFLNQILASKKEINIVLETSERAIVFSFDEYHLSQVVNNLLTNAIKFTEGKSEIVVRVSLTRNKGVLTEVIDHGKGIAPEEQEKLFSYFHTTSTRPTLGEKSTGLGLAITKKIVNEHGGEIGLKSELGKGSNFYFELF